MKHIEGEWSPNDIRRAFVEGAKWWEYHQTGATMWQSDQRLAEEEAERKYGDNNLYCPKCGDLLSEHIVNERGQGWCE